MGWKVKYPSKNSGYRPCARGSDVGGEFDIPGRGRCIVCAPGHSHRQSDRIYWSRSDGRCVGRRPAVARRLNATMETQPNTERTTYKTGDLLRTSAG